MFKLFRKNVWPPNYQSPPWGNAPSIYAHISAHIDPDKPGLLEGGYRLPDEAEPDPNKVLFAPGAFDGVMGHHCSAKLEDQMVVELYAVLKNALGNATGRNVQALYSSIKNNDTLGVIDALIEHIQSTAELDAARLRELTIWFATKGADREPVKFAMALLGLLRGWDDLEVFLTLGRHDEFTLYSAVAISSNEAYGERPLCQLAKSTEGWGRISTVERLASTTDPEVKDWLIRDGYKNDVMYEYLACVCARAGDLHLALGVDDIDDDLFQSACEIIDTLVSGEGGPAEGLPDYEHGCSATLSLLRHGQQRFGTASHYRFLSMLRNRIDDHINNDRQMEQDWTDEKARQIADGLNELLSQDRWHSIILGALEEGDRQAFWDASRISEKLGIDPWPYFLRRTGDGEEYWWNLMRTDDEDRIDQVLELAKQRIPLGEIESGPDDALGLGSGFLSLGALDFILQDIGRFPGKGWEFVRAGLQSPTIRNRNIAMRALSEWGQDAWPSEAMSIVQAAAKAEPIEDVRNGFEALLAGEPIS